MTSKRAAVLGDPIWKALDISASAFANNSTIPGRISAYRVGERCVEIIVNLSTFQPFNRSRRSRRSDDTGDYLYC